MQNKNKEKLRDLLISVFLLDESEFRFDLKREEIVTWDSLGTVAMAVGIQDAFGCHFSAEEATSIQGVSDVMKILEANGISFVS